MCVEVKVCGVNCIFHSVINVMGSLLRCSGSMECYLGLVFYLKCNKY